MTSNDNRYLGAAVAVGLLATLLVACGAAPAATRPATPASVVATLTPSLPATIASTTAPPSSSPVATLALSPLEDVWHTAVVTPDAMRAALQAKGLQEWIQPFIAGMPDKSVFTLRVLDGRWVQYWSRNGGADEENDSGPYKINGDNVTISHDDPGSDTLSWSVDGDTLALKYVSDTFPARQGIPESVYQTAFYESSPWTHGAP